MMLVKTSIAGFDEFCSGGLSPGAILLYGVPGSGNDTFARHVFFNRAKDEANVTYFTTMVSPDVVENELSVFGWSVSSLKDKVWKFVDLNGAKSITKLVNREMKDGRWITIDSFSDILLTQDLGSAVNLLNSMSLHAKKNEGLYFALLTEGMHGERVETAMQHFADGVIKFSVAESTASRWINIKKMREMVVSSRSIPFSIGENGFVIETAVRIT